jgi:hypothetical protein
MLEGFEQLGGIAAIPTAPTIEPYKQGVEILAKNMTGDALKEYSIVGVDKPAFDEPDAVADDRAVDVIFRGVVVEVVEATEGEHADKWAVLLEPLADGQVGRAFLPGCTWARVDIKSDGDEKCGIADTVKDNLVSGTGSTPIIWAPDGTGIKWCIVRLGAGGGANVTIGIINTYTPSNWTGDILATGDANFWPLSDQGSGLAVKPGNHQMIAVPYTTNLDIPADMGFLALKIGGYLVQIDCDAIDFIPPADPPEDP